MKQTYKRILHILLLVSVVGCQAPQEPPSETELATLPPIAANQAIAVTTSTAQLKPFTYQIQTSGKIVAKRQTELHFQVSGVLQTLYKPNGAYVSAGEPIAAIDSTELSLALEKAEATLHIRQGDYQLKLDEFSMYNGDTATLNEQQRLNMRASSGLDLAQIEYKEAKNKLRNATLYAPFSGRIANLNAQEGSLLSPQEPFCTLYAPEPLQVKIAILETELPRIALGQQASVVPVGSPQVYQATLSQINPMVNENGMVELLITLQDAQGLLPGMHASVTLHVPQKESVVVPKEAIVIRSGKAVVFVVEEERAKWHYVTQGLENGEEVEIVEGLQGGETVIISNNLQLEHDTPVAVAP